MVGYDLEDRAYCMELTYNYGLDDPSAYKPGTGLTEFGIFVPDVDAAKSAAQKLGYAEEEGCIVGPDKYRFRLFPMPSDRSEHFLYVMCRSGNLAKTVGFYKDVLGMSDVAVPELVPKRGSSMAAVSYTSKTHPHQREPVMLVWYEDGIKPQPTPWEGRHALGLDAEEIKAFHARYQKEFPDKIMHQGDAGPISLQEKLGTLFIFIARDIDGYEMCYVSRETMLPAVVEAVTNYDGKALDWTARQSRIEKIAAAGKQVEELLSKHSVVLFSKEWRRMPSTASRQKSSLRSWRTSTRSLSSKILWPFRNTWRPRRMLARVCQRASSKVSSLEEAMTSSISTNAVFSWRNVWQLAPQRRKLPRRLS